MKEDN